MAAARKSKVLAVLVRVGHTQRRTIQDEKLKLAPPVRRSAFVSPLLGGPLEQVRDRLGPESGTRADNGTGRDIFTSSTRCA